MELQEWVLLRSKEFVSNGIFPCTGKTSLISVAANLIASQDDIASGEIRINGDVGKLPKRLVGVVWQDDLLLSNLTVEETIYFSARLKTPCNLAIQSH